MKKGSPLGLLIIGGWSIHVTGAFGAYFTTTPSIGVSSKTTKPTTTTTTLWLSSSSMDQVDQQEQEVAPLLLLRSHDTSKQQSNRRRFVTSCTSALGTALVASSLVPPTSFSAEAIEGPTSNEVAAPKIETDKTGVTVFKTRSGLQYIELQPAPTTSTITPRYGQLAIISYTAYMKLPKDTKKQKFDEDKEFVLKHGNAKMIPGLDEGIHTMKVGSTRRIIIPPKLGFTSVGLGPLPEFPWNRWKLNSLMDDMVTQRGGDLIYDVTLLKVLDDEADQGYYEDSGLTTEEFEELQQVLNKKAGNTV